MLWLEMKFGTIYIITNVVNGKQYIGQTIQKVRKRFNDHKSSALINKTGCDYLWRAMRKYGTDSFMVEVIVECKKDLLDEYEEMFVDMYDTTNPSKGYNLQNGGKTHAITDAIRQNMSMSKKKEGSMSYGLQNGITRSKDKHGEINGYLSTYNGKLSNFDKKEYTDAERLEAAIHYKTHGVEPEWYVKKKRTKGTLPKWIRISKSFFEIIIKLENGKTFCKSFTTLEEVLSYSNDCVFSEGVPIGPPSYEDRKPKYLRETKNGYNVAIPYKDATNKKRYKTMYFERLDMTKEEKYKLALEKLEEITNAPF
jgi:group I intron endonuclease